MMKVQRFNKSEKVYVAEEVLGYIGRRGSTRGWVKHPLAPRDKLFVKFETPEGPRSSQRVPEALRHSQRSQRLPEGPRGSQRVPKAPRGSQKFPEAPRSSQRVPEAPRSSQKVPERSWSLNPKP